MAWWTIRAPWSSTLTDLVHGYGYTFQGNLQDASVTNSPTYADGRLVLFIEWSGGSYGAVVVLDEQGKVVFTVGGRREAFQFADPRARPAGNSPTTSP